MTDFGISRVDEPGQKVKAFVIPDIRGLSFHYAAPEVLNVYICKKDERTFEQVLTSDVYSFGCMLYELVTNELVWD